MAVLVYGRYILPNPRLFDKIPQNLIIEAQAIALSGPSSRQIAWFVNDPAIDRALYKILNS